MEQIADGHEQEYFPITFYQLAEKAGSEVAENLFDHGDRGFETAVTEEDPAKTDEVEGQKHTQDSA